MATTISPTIRSTATSKLITLSAGCFWGVESVFRRQFTNKGLIDIKVGYANGNPSITDIDYKKYALVLLILLKVFKLLMNLLN